MTVPDSVTDNSADLLTALSVLDEHLAGVGEDRSPLDDALAVAVPLVRDLLADYSETWSLLFALKGELISRREAAANTVRSALIVP